MSGTTVDFETAQQICSHWDKLMYLRLIKRAIDEDIVLMLIKRLPTLQVLDAVGGAEWEVHDVNPVDPFTSRLTSLRMHCNQTSTLEQVLQLCPQLTRLSLRQQQRSKNAVTNYIPVETSLHLLRNTSVRALSLAYYSTLCNDDLLALHDTDLHTLSIMKAGSNLHNKAILALLPKLRSLTTLALSCCAGLSDKLASSMPFLTELHKLQAN